MITSTDQFISTAAGHGLALDADRLTLNESGADFLVAHAFDTQGHPWILRAPRRPDVHAVAEAEGRILALVRSHLPVAVPDWRIQSPDLIAYPRLAGEPAATPDPVAMRYDWLIDPQSPAPAFIETLAAALAALHRIPAGVAAAAGLPVTPADELRPALMRQIDRVREHFDVAAHHLARWERWLANDPLWPRHAAVIHGDLHPAHVLVDADHLVCGLLDWTEAAVGDPAVDFAMWQVTLGEAAFDDLLHQYERARGRVWPGLKAHTAERYAAFPITLALFALRSGDETFRTMARDALLAPETGPESA